MLKHNALNNSHIWITKTLIIVFRGEKHPSIYKRWSHALHNYRTKGTPSKTDAQPVHYVRNHMTHKYAS